MTRKIITMSIILIAVFSAFNLTGCTKDEPAEPTNNTETKETGMDNAANDDHAGHDHDDHAGHDHD